jgi:hypothetical protein
MIRNGRNGRKIPKGTKTEHFATQVEVDNSITIDTNHGSNRHDIEKIFSQTLRNILHWVRAH